MFTWLEGQQVRHESGYVVAVRDSRSLRYQAVDGRTAFVGADLRAQPCVLYSRDVHWSDGTFPTETERVEIVERVRLGMLAMVPEEVCVE